jgi:hypothetical protein
MCVYVYCRFFGVVILLSTFLLCFIFLPSCTFFLFFTQTLYHCNSIGLIEKFFYKRKGRFGTSV